MTPLEKLAAMRKAPVTVNAQPTAKEIVFTMDDFKTVDVQKLPDAPEPPPISFTMEDFGKEKTAETNDPVTLETGEKIVLENNTRKTLERMFLTAPIGTEFTFYVIAGRGESYVFSLRTLISRMRDRLRSSNKKVQEFKLNVISIKRIGRYDRVTLIRAKPGVGSRASTLYSKLEELFVEG